MKFYLCQTPDGPKYARTQAEAKALDPKFTLVEYDTSQQGLVDRFNDLLGQSGIRINGVPAEAADVVAIGRAMVEEDGGYPEPPAKPTYSQKQRDRDQRQWDAITMEEFIFSVPASDKHMLMGIVRAAQGRLEEFEGGAK